MSMKKPAHPGALIREDCIKASGLTITEAAKCLGVIRQTLDKVVNERGGISAEMAIRLEKMGWSNAEHWRRMQMAYDMAQVRARQGEIIVQAAAL